MNWLEAKSWLGISAGLPEKWKNQRWQDVPLLAIDLELTSLDTKVAAITSIGWVSGQNGQLDLKSAFYKVVNTPADLQQSPVIHGLTAEHIAQGGELAPILQKLATMLHSHVWVFHHAPLDTKVLLRDMQVLNIDLSGMLSLDTLCLEKYLLNRVQPVFSRDSLTLADCCRRYAFPPAPVHNALDDAMATLELAFAQLNVLKAFPHKVSDLKHCRSLQTY
ncbi:3'-5' exonuclease [Paraglaciecola sp.]|uniref:3'-5' exonuclease n=1 Tax=Paraglaciecola sp. TaxID=1920173 RepID=UPI0030F4296C